MSKIIINLPDGSELSFESGISVKEVAYSIGSGLGRAAVAGRLDGKLVDLDTCINKNVGLSIITLSSEEGLDVYRHTTAHIMAQAVKRIYGDMVKLAIGPTIENGFYYDFDIEQGFAPDDLIKIKKEMKKIIKEDLPIERELVSRGKAIKLMKEKGEDYKAELIEDFDDEYVSLYHQGEFTDLCRGPHLPSTGKVKAYELLSLAGAYWRGDENNKMLQRIYGTSFIKNSELREYLERQEEAKKRDHRKLGKELDLFSFHQEGAGFPLFHPKGMVFQENLVSYWREVHKRHGYQEIKTPVLLNSRLWEQSGHMDHYKENMYFTEIDGNLHAMKPMNCPGGILYYKNTLHSYREFPMRIAELGLVHRHELSGTLHGLMRVRAFTQDDAHIFMLPEQIKSEIIGVLNLVDDFYSVFGFDYSIELSTRPEKAMGTEDDWERATNGLISALEELELEYDINEGDGAFYGPKIDIHLEDSLGRHWQCATIQLDFQLPERFELSYIGPDGMEHQPVMVHRVVMGALERFMGILIEHYAGAFPTWLAPQQAVVIPVSDGQAEYAYNVKMELEREGVRIEVDGSHEKLGYRIRQAQLNKIPYMLVVGNDELDNNTVSVRDRDKGDLGNMSINEFTQKILKEITNKNK